MAKTKVHMDCGDCEGTGAMTVGPSVRQAPRNCPTCRGSGHLLVMAPQTIEGMMAEVVGVNTVNGWFDDNRTFGEDIALLHSEVSEALEEWRDRGLAEVYKFESEDGYSIVGRNDPNFERWITDRVPKPLGVGSEAADVFIRLLDFCYRHDIDLRRCYEEKIQYNRIRGYRHGGKNL